MASEFEDNQDEDDIEDENEALEDEQRAIELAERKRSDNSNNQRQFKNEEFAYKIKLLEGQENFSKKFENYFNIKFRSTQLTREDLEYYKMASDLLLHCVNVGSRLNRFSEKFYHEICQDTDWQSSLDGFERQQQNTSRMAIDRTNNTVKSNQPPKSESVRKMLFNPFKRGN